jgi:putative nucleotidyltransferase with HDIG domain
MAETIVAETPVFGAELEAKTALPLDALTPGLCADCDVFNGDTLLLSKGSLITDRILESLRLQGIGSIAVASGSELARQHRLRVGESVGEDLLSHILSAPEETYSQHGIELALPKELLENTTDQIETAFLGLETGQPLSVVLLRQTVRSLVELVCQRPGRAIKLLDLDRFDRYTYRHSLNVALLFMAVGQNWANSPEELSEQVLGALLHDVGKMRVGRGIINKPGILTERETFRMRKHCEWGQQILAKDTLSPQAREMVISHHERLDGRGYPHGRKAGELMFTTRMASICDVYDALTTNRCYKAKMNFSEAIDLIVQSSGTQFDPEMLHLFITTVGRHPIGSFVQLSTGEVAVVVRLNPTSIARPIVSRVLNKDGEPTGKREELDLSTMRGVRISRVLSPYELTRWAG